MKQPDILTSEKLQAFQADLKQGKSILIEGLWDTPKAIIASLAQRATQKHILIVTGGARESRLYDDFPFLHEGSVVEFPAWETLPSELIAPSPDIVGIRYQALHKIITATSPLIILCPLQACLQKTAPPKMLASLYLPIRVGEKISFDKLPSKLTAMGYERCAVAADKGEFAVRGGIIDIFPVSEADPVRIEFWDDDVESIRFYDPVGQKSMRKAESITITPAQELELINKQGSEKGSLATLCDYLGNNTLVLLDDLLALEDRYISLQSIPGAISRSFVSFQDFLKEIAPLQKIFLSQSSVESLSEIRHVDKETIAFEMFTHVLKAKRWQHPFFRVTDYVLTDELISEEVSGETILQGLSQFEKSPIKLRFLSSTAIEEKRLRDQLASNGVPLPANTEFVSGYLSSGFVLPDIPLLVIPQPELTHRHRLRREKMRGTVHTPPSVHYELTPGDLVVHFNNGIGKYLGIENQLNVHGIQSEYLVIEYAENGKLFVPLTQSHLVSKYIGSHDETPRLHTIGNARWKQTKARTEKAIAGYAKDLLKMYAERDIHGGYIFDSDSEMLQNFEEDFPYSETEDQLQAISSIKQDMCSNNAMDRLICGDVGYGKTEVAMRAAFKAVVDGPKQVAVLVPTTVLAMQHYETFVERMSNFPVRIGVLSRFRTSKEIKETLEGVANGSVDILIGTHRIISDDVIFQNLGLIIIDEEQRFGVRAKEHLKTRKIGVDCLTLSATPIPRTLYMSLIGARDMSTISTPPQDRLPIKTVLCESNEQVIQNALLRELSRDGQAYVIHNRVDSIFDVASRIKKAIPQARVVVGHGQMSSDEIDSVFHAFKSGSANILVATTIVENGIDIPNANTIIIDRADQFGMADLYQLRGRVGRWNRRAYAYFLTPANKSLPELTQKRLAALAQTGGYGGGMKVAMRDLEIRGAGDILGTEQSGHVSSIGFHLYCKLLRRTIETLQGKTPYTITETRIDFPQEARIPETYVNETSLRMELYQRLGEALSFEDVDGILEEMKDRFGKPPLPIMWLYHLTRLRVFASQNHFTLLKLDNISLTAEQKAGEQSIIKRVIVPTKAVPAELEKQTIKALKKAFDL